MYVLDNVMRRMKYEVSEKGSFCEVILRDEF